MHSNLDSETAHWERLVSGDIAGFRAFMKLYFPVICSFAERFVADNALAKDIAQETFIKIWHQHTSFESLNSLKKFMYVTARNNCLNVIRDKQRADERSKQYTRLKEEDDRFTLDEMMYSELLVAVREAVEALPPKMKEIFILGYIEGLGNQEIADRLQISQQTVRNQKTRALQHLKVRFGEKHYPLFLLLALYSDNF